jgi:hypothetical protein
MQNAVTAAAPNPLEEELPPVAPLPPLITALQALDEGQYDALFKFVVRALLQRPWADDEYTLEDVTLLLNRCKRLFRGRSKTLTDVEMDAIIAGVEQEPVPRAVLSHCVAFTSNPDSVVDHDEYRASANFFDPREAAAFMTLTTEVARQRLEMSNRTLGLEHQRRQRSQEVYEFIRSGESMSSAADPALDIPSDFRSGCFGGSLQIEFQSLVWRKELADQRNKNFGVDKVSGKVQVSVQLLVDDEPMAEATIRGFAREVFTDPTVEHSDGTVEVSTIGTARYWVWKEPACTTLFIGHERWITAERTKLAIHVRQPKRFGCFAFDDVATVEVPLSSLYRDVMPLGDPSREKFRSGYHFTFRQHVDEISGMGAAVALNLNCLTAAHTEKPHFFDPAAPPEDGNDMLTQRHYSVWAEAFHFPHHSALLHLFEMIEEVTDLEFEILNAYRDCYFLDAELYHMAVCVARAKTGDVRDLEDLKDALKAVEYIVGEHSKTRAAERLKSDAIPAIRQRFMGLLCETEAYTSPRTAYAAVFVAREIMNRLGIQPHEISDAIRDVIASDLRERARIHGHFSPEELPQRATQVFLVLNTELATLGRSLRFARESGDGRVLALAAHRISCQLDLLTPFLERFVRDATQRLVSGGERVDPLGETFCILCSVQQRTVDCYDAIRSFPALQAHSRRLLSIFENFLSVWLTLARPRMEFCVREVAKITPIEAISSRCLYSEAPADAVNLLSEVVDFFWNCAMCSPHEVVAACLMPFASLLVHLARTFESAFASRVDSLDWRRRTSTGSPVVTPQQECIAQRFIGLASYCKYAELLRELAEDVTGPGSDLVGTADGAFDSLVPQCGKAVEDEFKQVRNRAEDFGTENIAFGSTAWFVRDEMAKIVADRAAAVDGVMMRFNGFLDLLKRSLFCKDIDPFGPAIVTGFGLTLATESSLIAPNAVRSNLPSLFSRVVFELIESSASVLPGALVPVLREHLDSVQQVLEMLREHTGALVDKVTHEPQTVMGRWAANILCLRGENGDSTARAFVGQRSLSVNRDIR